MALEVAGSSDRQVVSVTWDTQELDGELVKLYCFNPANGDVSVSGAGANDGSGTVTYPAGYNGVTEITVIDNHENEEFGMIQVADGDAVVVEDPEQLPPELWPPPGGIQMPEHPIELPLPPDPGSPPNEIWPPPGGIQMPEHPIVIPPPALELPPDFWTGNLPPSETPPDQAVPNA